MFHLQQIVSLGNSLEKMATYAKTARLAQNQGGAVNSKWISSKILYLIISFFSYTKKTPHLDRGLFEIFRYLLVAKTSKNDTNIICRSLKKKYFFLNLKTVAQKLCQLCSFHVWSSQRHGSLYISAIPIYSYGLLLMYSY